jgi:hypothetical protein
VGISAYIARLRAAVGHDLLLLPSVSVLPVDEAGRLLLVRHAGHHDGWAVLGVEARLVRLLDVLGGPEYEVRYPNGDRVAYVTTVYEAAITDGSPGPCDDELSDVAWFAPGRLAGLELSPFTRALLSATGYL